MREPMAFETLTARAVCSARNDRACARCAWRAIRIRNSARRGRSATPQRGIRHGVRCSSDSSRRFFMNWQQIEGKWDYAKGKLREKWGKLTDDDINVIA